MISVPMPGIAEDDLGHERAADDGAERQREAGHLRQDGVAVGVLAHELGRRAERLQVVGVLRLELVDDQVPHPDRPAAERDEEERQEREEPVADEATGELERPGRLQREVVRAGDGEEAELEGEEVDEDDREPHVRRRGEDVGDRERGVVEHLPAGRHRADAVAGDVAEHDRGDEERERVGDRGPDELAHRGADVGDARAEVAVQEPAPEVDVLPPERLVEAEGLGEVAVQLLRCGRVGLDPADQPVDRVARHQARDRPVDRHRHEEGEQVEQRFPGEVSGHESSGVPVVVSRHSPERAVPPAGEHRPFHWRRATKWRYFAGFRLASASMPVMLM